MPKIRKATRESSVSKGGLGNSLVALSAWLSCFETWPRHDKTDAENDYKWPKGLERPFLSLSRPDSGDEVRSLANYCLSGSKSEMLYHGQKNR